MVHHPWYNSFVSNQHVDLPTDRKEWCTYEENRATHAHAVIERKALELIAALCKKHAILFNLDNHISELEIDERVFTENKRYRL